MSWGSIAKIGGSLIGGLLNRGASKRAGKADSNAIAEQRRQFDLVRGDTAPYREAGKQSLNWLSNLYNGQADFSNILNNPYFDFGREQGMKGVNNMLARRGMSRSGAAMKEISRYNSDYNNKFLNNYINQQMQMANYGVGGNNASAAAGGRMANALTGIYGRQGQRAFTTGQNYNQAAQGGIQNYLLNKNVGGDTLGYDPNAAWNIR